MAVGVGALGSDQMAQLDAAVQAQDAQNRGDAQSFGVLRVPFLLSCRLWIENEGLSTFASANADVTGATVLQLPINPARVTWRMGYRTAEEKTRGGRVLYAWKNRDRNSFADEPVLTFNFKAGNIESGQVNEQGQVIPTPGRVAMWEFFRLLDEEKVIPAKINGRPVTSGVGEPNFVIITYRSIKFPLVTLFGFFKEEGIEFEDDATDPLNWSITANFVVYDSTPRISNAQDMKASFFNPA